jgi:hypothetical protein
LPVPPKDNVPAPRQPALLPLGRLAQYMNFWQIHETPPVLVTMDHRAVLVPAWAARRQGLFGGAPPLLLRLDAHPDMAERPRPWAYEAAQFTDLDAVHAVANDQRCDDGGWVISALQFGLARDVLTFFVHDYHRFPGDNGDYADHRGTEHEIVTFEGIRSFLAAPSRRATRLLEGAGHRTTGGWSPEGRPLWLDIDMDFATRRMPDDSVGEWTEEDWELEMGTEEARFLAGAFARASLVTISTEPEYCGGHGPLGRIAESFKRRMAPHGAWLDLL